MYRSYSIDSNHIIKYLGTNEAVFVDYQLKKPTIKNGSVVVPEIKIADNTVEGAIETLGDTQTATTTTKSDAVSIIKELNDTKLDGVNIIKRAQSKFGTWSGTAQNCQYKLATITIPDTNAYWVGSFKFLNSYKELDLTGTEFKISLRGGNRSIDDIELYELCASGVPEGTATGKAIVWVCYSRALAWPQTVEIWLQLLNVKWHEFEGEWLVKSSPNTGFILANDTIYSTPANDP